MAGGSRLHANYDAALLNPSFAGYWVLDTFKAECGHDKHRHSLQINIFFDMKPLLWPIKDD